MVIAIDGPAGAGKSTVARALAERLGFTYLDSGAMYRSVALRRDPRRRRPRRRGGGRSRLARDMDLRMNGGTVTIGDEDVTTAIRAPEVTAAASRVSVHRGVREAMVDRQRSSSKTGGWVAEGRDIGTVVCPEAPLKVFLTASEQERAGRRAAETGEDAQSVLAAQRDRDARDREREHGALHAAADAVEVDTTGLEVESIVERIAALASERGIA